MPVPKTVHYLRCLALHPDVAAVVFRHKVQKISRIELVTVGVIGTHLHGESMILKFSDLYFVEMHNQLSEYTS